MKEFFQEEFIHLLSQLVQLDTQLILLAVLVVSAIIVLDAVSLMASRLKEETGVNKSSKMHTIDDVAEGGAKNLVSEMQRLAGRPDAIVVEDNYFIPVERKPLSKKIRDRHVAQLLVYMRLIEEFEGKKPPYGYLILGKNCRRVKIMNTETRQEWLQKIIDEMQAILSNESKAIPDPHPRKCTKCTARQSCDARADLEQPIKIGSGA